MKEIPSSAIKVPSFFCEQKSAELKRVTNRIRSLLSIKNPSSENLLEITRLKDTRRKLSQARGVEDFMCASDEELESLLNTSTRNGFWQRFGEIATITKGFGFINLDPSVSESSEIGADINFILGSVIKCSRYVHFSDSFVSRYMEGESFYLEECDRLRTLFINTCQTLAKTEHGHNFTDAELEVHLAGLLDKYFCKNPV